MMCVFPCRSPNNSGPYATGMHLNKVPREMQRKMA